MALFPLGVAAAPGKPMCVAIINNKPGNQYPRPSGGNVIRHGLVHSSIVNRLLHIPMPKRQTIQGNLQKEIAAPPTMDIA